MLGGAVRRSSVYRDGFGVNDRARTIFPEMTWVRDDFHLWRIARVENVIWHGRRHQIRRISHILEVHGRWRAQVSRHRGMVHVVGGRARPRAADRSRLVPGDDGSSRPGVEKDIE